MLTIIGGLFVLLVLLAAGIILWVTGPALAVTREYLRVQQVERALLRTQQQLTYQAIAAMLDEARRTQ